MFLIGIDSLGRAHFARPTYNYYYSSLIHLVIVSSTSGAIVSSICWYSTTLPVEQCWNRWFTPSIFFIVCLQLESPVSSIVVLAAQSTWVSFVPLSANTGHLILDNCLPASIVMKWRMYGELACSNDLFRIGFKLSGTPSMVISLVFLPFAISLRIFEMVRSRNQPYP